MINKKLLKPIQNKGATKPDTSAKAHDTLLNRDKTEQHPISAITDLQTTLDAKQAKLTAGTGIDITGDVISATGNFVTLDTNQTITGEKTFTNGIKIDGATTIKGFTSINGNVSIIGVLTQSAYIDMGGQKIINLRTPTADNHAATKKYVDDAVAAALRPYLIDLEKRKET